MNCNVGKPERALRIIAGLVLIGLAVAGIGAPWTYIGIVPLTTGLMGWCPAYTLFGVKTCKVNPAENTAEK